MTRNVVQVSPLHYGIIFLTVATALIHILLAFQFEGGPDPLFILNGLGYLGLLVLLYAPVDSLSRYRWMVRWVLIVYTALTVVLWVFIGARNGIAYLDKLIEVALIVLLWLDSQRSVK
jgi:hypothetical protein